MRGSSPSIRPQSVRLSPHLQWTTSKSASIGMWRTTISNSKAAICPNPRFNRRNPHHQPNMPISRPLPPNTDTSLRAPSQRLSSTPSPMCPIAMQKLYQLPAWICHPLISQSFVMSSSSVQKPCSRFSPLECQTLRKPSCSSCR